MACTDYDIVDAASTTTLLSLPAEVLLLVISALDPGDVLTVRKTCRILRDITYDRSLWLALYDKLCGDCRHPLPNEVTSQTLVGLTTNELESFVMSVYTTDKRWQLPRGLPYQLDFTVCPPPLNPSGGTPRSAPDLALDGSGGISNMTVLSDRWLVLTRVVGIVEVWDLCPISGAGVTGLAKSWREDARHATRCRARFEVQPSNMSVMCMERSGTAIILATSDTARTDVFHIDLSSEESPAVCVATFPPPSPQHSLRAIDPTSQMLIYAHALDLCFVNWATHEFYTVSSREDGEELWTGIAGIAFLTTQHILCIKTRSVDVYTVDAVPGMRAESTHPLATVKELSPLRDLGQRLARREFHPIPDLSFRGVSFSEPQVSKCAETDIYTASFLAYDVLRGLFHYQVKLTLPHFTSDSPHPVNRAPVPLDVSCELLAAHHMAQLRNDGTVPRSGYTTGSRAFISATALGARGKRGVWIERERKDMNRAVFGFAAADYCPVAKNTSTDTQAGSEETSGALPPTNASADLKGKCLYEVRNSYDLRDDLTHCAFSEATGKIVLATRRGQLQLL